MRIAITIFLFLCIGAGHYFLHAAPIENFVFIQLIASAALSCLSLFGALFLALQSGRLRLRKICAFQIAMVALASLATMTLHLLSPASPETKAILSPGMMLYGNIYAFVFSLYPLELMRPGWLNIRRTALFFLPVVVLGTVYFTVVHVQKNPVLEIRRWSDLVENFRRFDVWFRLLILIYPVYLFGWMLRFKRRYGADCSPERDNNSELLNNYNIGFALILVSYIVVTMISGHQCLLLHGLLFLVFTSYLLYQNLFNIRCTAGQACPPPCTEKIPDEPQTRFVTEQEQRSFTGKIPQYKEMLERWMSTEKPYNNPHFKLLDCMSVLPLNRSYISRLFNEGYHETFFAFIMRYRINESIRLLNGQPELTIVRISEMCGFSSPSVFGRAFLRYMGITPLQYRRNNLVENKADKSGRLPDTISAGTPSTKQTEINANPVRIIQSCATFSPTPHRRACTVPPE